MVQRGVSRIAIPDRLVSKLAGFRRALLRRVIRDGLAWTLLVALLMLLAVLVLDRFIETSSWIRAGLLGGASIAAGLAIVRFWRANSDCRSLLRIAKVIGRREPFFGDHLVGALELAESDSEQARSATLCVAALEQVAEDAENRDLLEALPLSRWQVVARALLVTVVVLVGIGLIAPQLVRNAAERLLTPFSATPRYTFVTLPELPEMVVVPRDEASTWTLGLGANSRWNPSEGSLWISDQPVVAKGFLGETHSLDQAGVPSGTGDAIYRFEIPALIEASVASLRIGDATGTFRLVPKIRPELTAVRATVQLPDYVANRQADHEIVAQWNAGVIQVVQGSAVTLHVTASTALSRATVDGESVSITGDRFTVAIPHGVASVGLDWTDADGLRAREPMTVTVRQVPDRRPTLLVESATIPNRVLDSQALKFGLIVHDDIAVRRVGLEWKSATQTGERVLGPNGDESALTAVFQATALSVPLGSVSLRFWAEDDFPGRERVYSDSITLSVLSPDEHAVWIAGQFTKWRQAAMDVRDRELNLFEINRELAATKLKDRDNDWRVAVARQADAEQFNGRQLQSLTEEGQELLRQAARNREVAVDYVEKLAKTIETLEKLSGDRMPKIADLLKQAAKGQASQEQEQESEFAKMVDVETSQGQLPEDPAATSDDDSGENPNEEATERLGLAGTTIVDTSKHQVKEKEDEKQDALSVAVEDQTDLLAEFDAVAEELRALLGNMEGSTLVKRLKSVSRLQNRVAMQLGKGIEDTFGEDAAVNDLVVQSVASDVADSAARVRTVLDDLDAFCQRREIEHYASVLAEMKQADVLQQLTDLENRVAHRPGVSIAIAEFWADNLDRWADDLVDPGQEQSEQGSKSKQSLDPAVILEVLRILESEVNLREQTRVAEQGRGVAKKDVYMGEAIRLSESQDLLRDRLDIVVQGLEGLPEGIVNFSAEIEVLGMASGAMADATKTLVSPETGPVAIAAQTEAIELMLRSKKVSPEGGGGGGGNAGGGDGGETDQAAIAMLGRGLNALAQGRESETELVVGRDRGEVPEQWREGLELYFDQLERRRSGRDGGIDQ